MLGSHSFTLEYRGPFSCEPVPYLTAGCAAAVLVALLVAKSCYKRKRNWTKMKSAQMQGQVDRHMQYRQPWWSGPPIRSWYPGYLASSRFPQVYRPTSVFWHLAISKPLCKRLLFYNLQCF